jgi:hypothetical protein
VASGSYRRELPHSQRDAGALIADADQHRVRKIVDYYVVNSLRGKTERIERLCGARVG